MCCRDMPARTLQDDEGDPLSLHCRCVKLVVVRNTLLRLTPYCAKAKSVHVCMCTDVYELTDREDKTSRVTVYSLESL